MSKEDIDILTVNGIPRGSKGFFTEARTVLEPIPFGGGCGNRGIGPNPIY
jgi:hypothetical protein